MADSSEMQAMAPPVFGVPSTENTLDMAESEPEPDVSLFGVKPESCCVVAFMTKIQRGAYKGVISDVGFKIVNPCGTSLKNVNLARTILDLDSLKVLEANGSPLIVSGVVCFRVINAKRAAIDITNPSEFVKQNAQAVMKRVASQFPYESDTGPCLKTEAAMINAEMLDIGGLKVISFELTDLSYAPEIASAMLVKQQAEATVKARKVIVEGAVDITHTAIMSLEQRGIQLSDSEKARCVTNLLTVICGDSNVQPTVSVG